MTTRVSKSLCFAFSPSVCLILVTHLYKESHWHTQNLATQTTLPSNVKLFGSQFFAGLDAVQLLGLLRNRKMSVAGQIKLSSSPVAFC